MLIKLRVGRSKYFYRTGNLVSIGAPSVQTPTFLGSGAAELKGSFIINYLIDVIYILILK